MSGLVGPFAGALADALLVLDEASTEEIAQAMIDSGVSAGGQAVKVAAATILAACPQALGAFDDEDDIMEVGSCNPIESVVTFAELVGGPPDVKLYASLCMEEMGEVMQEFSVTDGHERDEMQGHFARALGEYAAVLRSHADLRIEVVSKANLLKEHLDSAWVHLAAALALLDNDEDRLHAAWAELHESNITNKLVWQDNGSLAFVKDADGKVMKPEGWVKPDFAQFFAS